MMNEEKTEVPIKTEKIKNPKRVLAGKRGAEAKKMKTELRRKEMETMKKENIRLKEKEVPITKDDNLSITKDDNDNVKEVQHINIYKNYLPLCLIGVVGLGLYFYNKQTVVPTVVPVVQRKEIVKEYDPFEFK